MRKKKTTVLYILLIILMALDIYSIFNAGNPRSLFRFLVRDSSWDFLITGIISAGIITIVITMNALKTRTDDPVYLMLLENKPYITKLREKGQSDDEIANSFAEHLKTGKIATAVARRKAVKHLKRI